MKDEDRRRLRDAFNDAITNGGPALDVFIEGMYDVHGHPMTRRKLLERTRDNEMFYEYVDCSIREGRTTIEKVINGINPPRP